MMLNESDVMPACFADETHALADVIAAQPLLLGADVQLLAREPTLDNLRPDFLAWAQTSKTMLVVELKNHPASDTVLLQTLKYANCLQQQPVLAQYYLHSAGVAAQFHPERLDICVVAPKIPPSLTSLSRYIAPFQFRFIELRIAHDLAGQPQLLATRIETPQPGPPRLPTAHNIYHVSTPACVLRTLQPAIKTLTQHWLTALQPFADAFELCRRDARRIIRFQTVGGRTAFALVLRKTRPPVLELHLGEMFDAGLATSAILRELRYSGKPTGSWRLPLSQPPHRLPPPVALLEVAANRVNAEKQ